MKKKECSICGGKAEIKVEATITISTVAGVLKTEEDFDELYVCDRSSCEAEAAKRLKRAVRGLMM